LWIVLGICRRRLARAWRREAASRIASGDHR
jgi:hypothetical protein